jgi:hypothetical protein
MRENKQNENGNGAEPENTATGLAHDALGCAWAAAEAYFRAHSKVNVKRDELAAAVRVHVAAAMGGALADARAAIDAFMPEVAVETFRASMALAGITAAKEVCQ